MRILVSGASGFIGRPLTFFLASQGHTALPLPRDSLEIPPVDAVIHLAGEPLTLNRWSDSKKQKIYSSRVDFTQQLCRILLSNRPPQIFISASATGYYGDRGEELLTEASPPGQGFLAHVCSDWEKASQELTHHGVRTVQTRFGIVLGPDGGALQKLLLPYKLGLGGSLGSGQQWMSWISLTDLIHAINHILNDPTLHGPINLVSPHPIRQQLFSSTLANLLHRPRLLPIPAWVLRFCLGESANSLLLSSVKVQPTKLLASNFPFLYPDLRAALQHALKNKE
jgi:uncharacterized protein (TIGR01777 family)